MARHGGCFRRKSDCGFGFMMDSIRFFGILIYVV